MFTFKGSQISSLTEFVQSEVVEKAAYGVTAGEKLNECEGKVALTEDVNKSFKLAAQSPISPLWECLFLYIPGQMLGQGKGKGVTSFS